MRAARNNIIHALVAHRVDPGVQEPHGRHAGCDAGVVEQGDDAARQRAAGTGTTDGTLSAVVEVGEVHALGGDVGVSTARLVVQAVERAIQALDISIRYLLLVGRRLKVVAEATARGVSTEMLTASVEGRAVCNNFGLELHGGADGGDVGAAGREPGKELGGVLAIVGHANSAIGSDTIVTTREEDGRASRAGSGKFLAHTGCVREGNGLLVIAVRGRNDLRDAGLGQQVVEPYEVGLVGVARALRRGNERRAASCRVALNRGSVADTSDGLDIQVGLFVSAARKFLLGDGTVSGAIRNGKLLEIRGARDCFGAVLGKELLGIRANGVLAEVVGEADFVDVGGTRLVALGAVQGLEAFGGNRADVADLVQRRIAGCFVGRRDPTSIQDVVEPLGAGAEERGGGLDSVDVVVQVRRERPLGGASHAGPVGMFVGVVLGIEKALNLVDGESDRDPIPGSAVSRGSDAIVLQPFVDEIQGFVAGLDKVLDVLLGEVLAIARVGRVRH